MSAVPIEINVPLRLEPTLPFAIAISATPPNVIPAPIQNARARCSSRRASEMSPMKIGVVPSRSATVEA